MLLSTRTTISTFCQASLELFHNRTRIPSGGGCGDVHLLQGPLRSASIFLPWLIAPLPPGARGSTLHNGPDPSQCNMSCMWNILTPWVVFCGHECGRSLLSIRTSCETGRRTRNYLKTAILKVETSTYGKADVNVCIFHRAKTVHYRKLRANIRLAWETRP